MYKNPLLVAVVRFFLFFWHPIFRVYGRENVKKDGRLMICANHSGAADPIWIVFALRLGHIPRIMAKKEIMQVPILGRFLRHVGAFGVDRQNVDVNAIKTGLRCLNENQQLLVFPEGTRVKRGERVEPKRGALTLAVRTNTPILPVYLSPRKSVFCPITCVIGTPYMPKIEGKKASDEELERLSRELMETIYELGDNV